MKIGVIGCGVGGQAAALFLRRSGHQVEIFERFPEAKPVGAGLLLQPPGQAALDELDAAIPLRLDSAVVDVANTEHPTLIAQSGERHGPFDLAIIAEGAHSLLRKKLHPRARDPVYRWGAIWVTCPDGEGRFARTLWQMFKGAGKMLGVLPIGEVPGGDGVPHVAMFWSLELDQFEAWQKSGLETWKSEVKTLWPDVAPLLDHVTDAGQLTLASYCDVVMRPWRNGRCLFIGDAAHGTSPQLGQGANLALVDAWTLSTALAQHSDIETALQSYERMRRGHVGYYQLASRWLTPFFQSHNRALPALRDAFMGPFCRLPLAGDIMVTTLSGVRCLPFGLWQPPIRGVPH